MNITATPDQSIWAVRLEAAAATGTVTWTRRVGGTDTAVGTGPLVWDYRPPLNTPCTYIAVDEAGAEVAGPVTVPSDLPVLSSTVAPIAYQVRVVDYRPLRAEAGSRWHPVLGRSDPFVTMRPGLHPSGMLRLWAASAAERTWLVDLLQSGDVLHLRSTCADRVDTMTFTWLRWEDPFAGEGRKAPPAYLEVEFQQVTDSLGGPVPIPDRTWQTILDDHATWSDVLAAYPTWRSVLEGPTP